MGGAPSVAPNADPANAYATWGLLAALVSIPLCCGLPSLLAGFLSLCAISIARRRGETVPAKAVVALFLALVSLALSGSLIHGVIRARQRQAGRVQALASRLAGQREASTLTRTLACDLIEEQLLAGIYEGYSTSVDEMRCDGPFEADAQHATVKDVEFESASRRIQLQACLGRASRWFVVALDPDGECPQGPWATAGVHTESELGAEERRVRQEYAAHAELAAVASFEAGLRTLRDRLATTERKESACPKLELPAEKDTDSRVRPQAVDWAFVAAHDAPIRNAGADWSFMTSPDVREALDAAHDVPYRARLVRQMARHGAPYLVVYQSEERSWPEVREKKGPLASDLEFVGGRYRGWIVLADLRHGRSVCESALVFSNSTEVKYDKRALSRESSLKSSLESELEDQFKDAATKTIKTMTDNQVRLGYRLLE
jgi:hypothetical protein